MYQGFSRVLIALQATLLIAAVAAAPGRVENPAPVLTDLSPRTVPANSPARIVEIHGRNFLSTSTASVNGNERKVSYNNAGRLDLTLQPADMAQPGRLTIAVTNPAPGGGTSAAFTLVIQAR